MRMVCHLSFFLAQGLFDELVRHQGSVAAGKRSLTLSALCNICVAFELVARRNEPGETTPSP